LVSRGPSRALMTSHLIRRFAAANLGYGARTVQDSDGLPDFIFLSGIGMNVLLQQQRAGGWPNLAEVITKPAGPFSPQHNDSKAGLSEVFRYLAPFP